MKSNTLKKALLPLALLTSTSSFAADPSHLEMAHNKGAFMMEYRYMHMSMEGLQSGTSSVKDAEALSASSYNHLMIPTKMTMDMHMLMPMYNITKDTSVMLMANYVSNKMDMEMRSGMKMDMETSGLSDTSVSVSHKFFDDMFAASFNVSVPTGSIDEKATMMMYDAMMDMNMLMEMTAPYAMQLGSGTYDITPSLTYLGAYFDLRYGAQVSYKLRTGENDNGYTLGDSAEGKAWVRKPVMGVSLDAELSVNKWGAIDGKDSSIGTMASMKMPNNMVMTGTAPPTSLTQNTGGTMATLAVGASVPVSMVSIGLDMQFPVYQDLNGLQMTRKMGYSLSLISHF